VLECVEVCSKLQLHIFNPKIPVDTEYHKVAVCCSVLQRVAVRTSERRVAQRVRDRTEQILPGH